MRYTADGLLTEFTNPKGQTVRFSYDTLGRLNTAAGLPTTTRQQPDGTRTAVAPDGTTLTTVPGPDPRFGMQALRIAPR